MFCLLALSMIVGGCSRSVSAEDVLLDNIGDESWEMILDAPVDDSMISLFRQLSGSEMTDSLGILEGSWIRIWDSGPGFITIIMGDPGSAPVQVRPDADSVLAAEGVEVHGPFGGIGGTVSMDVSDETGPATAVIAARSGSAAIFIFGDNVPEELAVSVVERQLDSLPARDPADSARPFLLAIFGPIFAIALWFAVRSTRRPSHEGAGEESEI